MGALANLSLVQRILGGLGAVALLIAGVWLYGHLQYKAGVRDTDQRWIAAGEKLKKEAAASASAADTKAAVATAEHVAQVRHEKEEIDEALARGDSPLDVLFPTQDR